MNDLRHYSKRQCFICPQTPFNKFSSDGQVILIAKDLRGKCHHSTSKTSEMLCLRIDERYISIQAYLAGEENVSVLGCHRPVKDVMFDGSYGVIIELAILLSGSAE